MDFLVTYSVKTKHKSPVFQAAIRVLFLFNTPSGKYCKIIEAIQKKHNNSEIFKALTGTIMFEDINIEMLTKIN